MARQPYLIFSLNQSLYGIDALAVQEVFFLPALTVIPEAPADIAGILNLRGEIISVIDLNLRFGYRRPTYQTSHSVIILKGTDYKVGVIVNQVHEVEDIETEGQNLDLNYGRGGTALQHRFLRHVVEMGDTIIVLLDVESLVRYGDQAIATDLESLPQDQVELPSPDQGGFAQVTPEHWQIFQDRANNLRSRLDTESRAGLRPLAVLDLEGEYFGISLDSVHEFTDIHTITPIPCCPPHIIGNVNLRGEVVTLLNISTVLNLSNSVSKKKKAIIIHLENLVAGVTVDDVLDIVYVHPSEIHPLPAAVHTGHDEYLEGIAPYADRTMSLLDLPKILLKGNLEVYEEV